MRRKNKDKILILALAFLILLPSGKIRAAGASLYLSPSAGTYVIDGNISISVMVDSGGGVINAGEGTISFDRNLLRVTGLSESSSIFSIWIEKPNFSNESGIIKFSGGIPKPGYSGANGLLFTINLKAIKAGSAQLRFSTGAVLANNEQGSNILASMGSASFIISPKVTAPNPADIPREESAGKDKVSPEKEDASGMHNQPIVISQSHPNQNAWSSDNNVKFNWKNPDSTTAIKWSFNKIADADPDQEIKEPITEKIFNSAEDGIWYFHLQFKDGTRWGASAHYKVMIDNTPPRLSSLLVESAVLDDWPILRIFANDSGSGISRYEFTVDDLQSQALAKSGEEDMFRLADYNPGKHSVLVKAIDTAGNFSYAKTDFEIIPIASPKIINYPSEIDSSDKFFLSGTALPDTRIVIYIQRGEKAEPAGEAKSDSGGKWFLISQAELVNGRYAVYAIAENINGIKSLPSDTITFLVAPPVFARVGSWVINYFTVIASLLFMLILIVASAMYLISIARRRLKKEAVEVEEVLGKRLNELKLALDEEFNNLYRASGTANFKKEGLRSKARLKAGIEEIEKKIGKEVKDVEELLK